MPNIKSAKKRVKVIETKTLQNKMFKSQLKTTVKKFYAAVESGDKEMAGVQQRKNWIRMRFCTNDGVNGWKKILQKG